MEKNKVNEHILSEFKGAKSIEERAAVLQKWLGLATEKVLKDNGTFVEGIVEEEMREAKVGAASRIKIVLNPKINDEQQKAIPYLTEIALKAGWEPEIVKDAFQENSLLHGIAARSKIDSTVELMFSMVLRKEGPIKLKT
ncbi:MAG: hypothetical protein ABSD68_03355 [Candidatus Micrarchaeales archaeon]|jgi:hypothetical protein